MCAGYSATAMVRSNFVLDTAISLRAFRNSSRVIDRKTFMGELQSFSESQGATLSFQSGRNNIYIDVSQVCIMVCMQFVGFSGRPNRMSEPEDQKGHMASIGRLNNIIRAWEEGRPGFCFVRTRRPQTAIEFSTDALRRIIFEMEHSPWDVQALQDALQYLLNRKQIVSPARSHLQSHPSSAFPQRGQNEPVLRQAGAGSRRLWSGLSAYRYR